MLKGVALILLQPDNFKLQTTTIWSFPDRGAWATHTGKYRGNWSPYVPRNIITRYSAKGEWILDQFIGSGTTLVEAKLLGRNGIGIDVNENALALSKTNTNFNYDEKPKIYIKQGDARRLPFIKNESIDLICTHPPYANIIKYSKDNVDDISLLEYSKFLSAMDDIAKESYRVLKQGRVCAFMMGDIRKHCKVVPLGFRTMECFLNAGFESKEIIIKEQHNCKSTPKWQGRQNEFLLLAHEYIFIFEKL